MKAAVLLGVVLVLLVSLTGGAAAEEEEGRSSMDLTVPIENSGDEEPVGSVASETGAVTAPVPATGSATDAEPQTPAVGAVGAQVSEAGEQQLTSGVTALPDAGSGLPSQARYGLGQWSPVTLALAALGVGAILASGWVTMRASGAGALVKRTVAEK